MRTTVLGLLGSLPRHAFETTAIATGDALANLMFQLQMTGYMFKNAEYRLSLQSSMRASAALPPGTVLASSKRILDSSSTWYMVWHKYGNSAYRMTILEGKKLQLYGVLGIRCWCYVFAFVNFFLHLLCAGSAKLL